MGEEGSDDNNSDGDFRGVGPPDDGITPLALQDLFDHSATEPSQLNDHLPVAATLCVHVVQFATRDGGQAGADVALVLDDKSSCVVDPVSPITTSSESASPPASPAYELPTVYVTTEAEVDDISDAGSTVSRPDFASRRIDHEIASDMEIFPPVSMVLTAGEDICEAPMTPPSVDADSVCEFVAAPDLLDGDNAASGAFTSDEQFTEQLKS